MAIKPLTECTMKEILTAWNKGFEGYFTDMTMNDEQFIKRMAFEDLSTTSSFVAFEGNQPVGIVLNGIREIKGKRVAWNGGTGVSGEYRDHGIGRQLIEESLKVYKRENADLATLESINDNESAIALYHSMDYTIKDHLGIFSTTEPLRDDTLKGQSAFHIEKEPAFHAANLPFYCKFYPWQNHWQSLKDGEIALIKDGNSPLGYALFKRKTDDQGKMSQIILYQCEVDPAISNPETLIKTLISFVFLPEYKEVQRIAFNLPRSKHIVTELLEQSGFKQDIEQVYMANQGPF